MEIAATTRVMGILNATPDSFSDGGELNNRDAVIHQIEKMIDAGVDIFDVGGESTRPFAESVPEQEELDRVIPVIERIRQISDLPISIDTTKSKVASNALSAGANMVNDISALRYDPEMVDVVKNYDGPVIIMHMQGTPGDMQVAPRYDDVVGEIEAFFLERINWLTANGIDRKRIIIDPGIGFGKTVRHNLTILKNISRFRKLGCPVLIGHSRKSFIGKILDLEVDQRDCATAMVSLFCANEGADIIRVHDIELSKQAVLLGSSLLSV
jgi:dihydropteroate synthase